LMQRFIDSILPGSGPATYSGDGQVLAGVFTQRKLYDAVG
jgi:hypothetical protein